MSSFIRSVEVFRIKYHAGREQWRSGAAVQGMPFQLRRHLEAILELLTFVFIFRICIFIELVIVGIDIFEYESRKICGVKKLLYCVRAFDGVHSGKLG